MPHYLSGIAHLEVFRRSNKKESLIQAETDLILRNPYGSATYLMLGETKSLQGKMSEARNFYKKAMKDPRYRNVALEGLKNLEKNESGAGLDIAPILK